MLAFAHCSRLPLRPPPCDSVPHLGPRSATGGRDFSLLRAAAELCPLLLIFTTSLLVDNFVSPYVRPVSDYDNGPSILFEKREQTVPSVAMLGLGYGLPIMFFLIVSALRFDAMLLYRALLGLFECYTITHALTTFGKKMSGSLRPNFLSLCEWNGTECTSDWEYEQSGRQSFPSGHASESMGGLCFLALFNNLYMPLLLPMIPKTFIRIPLVISPILIAYWIAISRTRDYYHRFEDIVAGMGIGVFAAVYTFFSQFGTNCSRCEEKFPYASPP
mmetsp:Transcript_45464/g.113981  ORF Transcript_45464/g.113981 Transcript_45464/m.113981 type:complete len:274 (-) Transcript_45464:60-881(-)